MNNIQFTKETVLEIIKIIKDATGCDRWADDVTESVEAQTDAKRSVPSYVWRFFDMTMGFDYYNVEDKTVITPWIQKQITKERYDKIKKRMADFQLDGSQAVRSGGKYVRDGQEFDLEEKLNEYYDSYNDTTSWAVAQLFMHRTIRMVGKGEEEENKYCFWPLSQPYVNHRPLDVGLIAGEEGFISRLSNSTGNEWESQQAFMIPYCVTSDVVQKEKKVNMTYMINSGLSKTNSDEYVPESERNGAAGNLHCVGVTKERLSLCIDCLTVSNKNRRTDLKVRICN